MIKKVSVLKKFSMFHLNKKVVSRCISTITLISLLIILSLYNNVCYAEIKETSDVNKMYTADFWTDKLDHPDEEVLSRDQIELVNKENLTKMQGILYDLKAYPSTISKDELLKLINSYSFPTKDRYINGQKVTPSYYDSLKTQMNFQKIMDKNSVSYGITIKRTNIRTFPTSDGVYTKSGAIEIDRFQETEVLPIEPVLILHYSADGQWGFVQTYNYSGWMLLKDVAISNDKKTWQDYISTTNFLIVAAKKLTLGFNPYSPELSELGFYMGNKIPLAHDNEIPTDVDRQSVQGNYVVKIPVRRNDGSLDFKLALIPTNSDVSLGYMPYTRANVINQAFKSLGERYGWGGEFNSKDCSSFIKSIFDCFGLLLPRNTGEQMVSYGKTFDMKSLNYDQRIQIMNELMPGSALYLPGHAMLYLGKYNDKYYIIHDVNESGDINHKKPDGTYEILIVNQVSVNDLTLPLTKGTSYLDSLVIAKQFEVSEPDSFKN